MCRRRLCVEPCREHSRSATFLGLAVGKHSESHLETTVGLRTRLASLPTALFLKEWGVEISLGCEALRVWVNSRVVRRGTHLSDEPCSGRRSSRCLSPSMLAAGASSVNPVVPRQLVEIPVRHPHFSRD